MNTARFMYNGMEFVHKGDYLYVDGIEWALIGSQERSEDEYLTIYRKYC